MNFEIFIIQLPFAISIIYLLLHLVKSPISNRVFVYVFFTSYFLGYFIKFIFFNYFIFLYPDKQYSNTNISNNTLISSVLIANLTFFLTLIGFFINHLGQKKKVNINTSHISNLNIKYPLGINLLFFTLISSLSLLTIMLPFTMGLEREQELPFKLEGVIVFSKLIFLPIIGFSLFEYYLLKNRKWLAFLFASLMFIYYFTDSISRASKAGIITYVIAIIMISYINNKIKIKNLLFVIAAILLSIYLFDFLGKVREFSHSGENIYNSLVLAVIAIQETATSSIDTFIKIVSRVTGAEPLAITINTVNHDLFWYAENTWINIFHGHRQLGFFNTTEIFGVPENIAYNYGIPVSYPGFIYLTSTPILFIFTSLMMGFFLGYFLNKRRVRHHPFKGTMAFAQFSLLFSFFTEGTLLTLLTVQIPFYIFSFFIVNFFFKYKKVS